MSTISNTCRRYIEALNAFKQALEEVNRIRTNIQTATPEAEVLIEEFYTLSSVEQEIIESPTRQVAPIFVGVTRAPGQLVIPDSAISIRPRQSTTSPRPSPSATTDTSAKRVRFETPTRKTKPSFIRFNFYYLAGSSTNTIPESSQTVDDEILSLLQASAFPETAVSALPMSKYPVSSAPGVFTLPMYEAGARPAVQDDGNVVDGEDEVGGDTGASGVESPEDVTEFIADPASTDHLMVTMASETDAQLVHLRELVPLRSELPQMLQNTIIAPSRVMSDEHRALMISSFLAVQWPSYLQQRSQMPSIGEDPYLNLAISRCREPIRSNITVPIINDAFDLVRLFLRDMDDPRNYEHRLNDHTVSTLR